MTPARKSRTLDGPADGSVAALLVRLQRLGSKANRDGMARYAIVSPKMFGVSVATLRKLAKEVGTDHALAMELWKTGWYEARMLACFVADPDEFTVKQMDDWARDFDNWAITDTACFGVFDRSPLAWGRVDPWCRRKAEFVRRAGFALLASLALHDKTGDDIQYRKRLALIEKYASDERNFVKKGVSWALHAMGARSTGLHKPASELAKRLAASEDATERWVGKDAMRKLASAATLKRLETKTSARKRKSARA